MYRGFDIGTAKPSAGEQKAIPHHLLDIRDAKEGFSAAIFKRLASEVIHNIQSQGKLPILVGGSGLYVDSLLFDYAFLPAGQTGERESLNELSIDELVEQIRDKGYSLDGIDTRNKRRLVRLLETKGERPQRQPLRPDTLILGLQVPQDELLERIARRVDAMLAAGLEDEVRMLASQNGWDTEPMKGIGYREFYDYFNGRQTLAQTRERIIRASAQLAKKQRTWFKRNKYIQWLDDPRKAVAIVTTFLNK